MEDKILVQTIQMEPSCSKDVHSKFWLSAAEDREGSPCVLTEREETEAYQVVFYSC